MLSDISYTKKTLNSPDRSRTCAHQLNALPLSYRRLIRWLGMWGKKISLNKGRVYQQNEGPLHFKNKQNFIVIPFPIKFAIRAAVCSLCACLQSYLIRHTYTPTDFLPMWNFLKCEVIFFLQDTFCQCHTDAEHVNFQVISSPQNFTIGVKVKDDGIIVSSFSSKGYQYTVSKPLSAVFNCTIVVSGIKQYNDILIELTVFDCKAN